MEDHPIVGADDLSEADIEAAADTASVSLLDYLGRAAFKPGKCAGYIINTVVPVARLAWPKGRGSKEFLNRIEEGAIGGGSRDHAAADLS
jgi:hypothetical protein